MVLDPGDDAIHTHTALAAHHPPSGRITLHPGPGTTSETGLAHDLLAALGKPPLLPGRFLAGRQPAWQAATAWMTALPITRLTVLRAHRLTARRTTRLLQLQALTGIHLTLVCHRPHLPAALHQALQTADYSLTADFEAAHRHYYGTPVTEPPPADEPAGPVGRWLNLPALDRLVSYDSPRPCADPCTPPSIAWRHRPPPAPLTAPTARRVAHRLHAATAHPRLAAAVAAALFTGASLQQLATARPRDYDDAAAMLALHDRARYTDGCAAYPVPPWAGGFLRAAACFTRLASGEEQELLAAPGDRGHLLRVAETARLRPPQPLAARRKGPVGRVEWDWRERQEAERYEAVPASRARSPRR
ncbi:hypothetical protein OG609_45960 (plasmid) [Streptomyces sp. NBC_01224]|uniref:hypothetical protein n=1 Tax=Streptomyces sp. NBC_01224 TaxID=2903783 RepID=UPI002E1061FF|nr:hypothetical protein OG609_00030 [Streptomyces sp. NBC_01224]WSQ40641.1 hypothetical protein OG609_44445 [Streptomyces sp. NBC_01224]WSQ41252.1 hypothetical protein OG609_44500 [Streptomyces sp. NBC_01224]WSQ41485.1 hypothetical protein OG609_45960 [Streptomyces sp. NBC_01224]